MPDPIYAKGRYDALRSVQPMIHAAEGIRFGVLLEQARIEAQGLPAENEWREVEAAMHKYRMAVDREIAARGN